MLSHKFYKDVKIIALISIIFCYNIYYSEIKLPKISPTAFKFLLLISE